MDKSTPTSPSILIHAVRAQLHLVSDVSFLSFSLLHAGSACKCLLSFPSHITDSIQDVPLTIHPGHYRMAGPCHHNFGLMNHYTFGGTRPLVLAERSKLIISCFDLAVKRPYCCEFVPANMFSFYSECLHPPTAIETSPGRLSYCSTIPRINSFIHIHILQIIRSVRGAERLPHPPHPPAAAFASSFGPHHHVSQAEPSCMKEPLSSSISNIFTSILIHGFIY